MMSIEQAAENLGRRRSPRRDFESPIGVLSAGKYGIERCYEVGEGGMTISTRRPLKKDAQIVITFFVQNQPIVVRAKVRSVLPAKGKAANVYGVEFSNLDFAFKRVIRNFVALASELNKTGS